MDRLEERPELQTSGERLDLGLPKDLGFHTCRPTPVLSLAKSVKSGVFLRGFASAAVIGLEALGPRGSHGYVKRPKNFAGVWVKEREGPSQDGSSCRSGHS